MRRLIAFSQITVDGYFTDVNGYIGWAHGAQDDAEWGEFVEGNASNGGVLLFGRITYEMMADYWPTPTAAANDPVVAERMNALPKVVFSRTLEDVSWSNTTLVKDDLVESVRTMKSQEGAGMAILGSGSIIARLSEARLIDEYQIVVNPIALGDGRTIFHGMSHALSLRLIESRTFKNGNVLLRYEPAS